MSKEPVQYFKNRSIGYGRSITDTCNVDIHLHDFNEIFIALTDNIRYYVEGNAYDMKVGDVIITNPYEIHRPTITDNGQYGRRFIQFTSEDFLPLFPVDYNPLVIFTDRPGGKGNLFHLNDENRNNVTAFFDKMEPYLLEQTAKGTLLLKSHMIQLLILLEELHEKKDVLGTPSITIDPRISKVLGDLDQHFTTQLNLDDLSHRHYMDKYYLCHLFKKNTGFSISEYLQSKRIQLAKQLIAQGHPISEVSLRCGFEDYSNFYKTFRKLVKMSPKAYRGSL